LTKEFALALGDVRKGRDKCSAQDNLLARLLHLLMSQVPEKRRTVLDLGSRFLVWLMDVHFPEAEENGELASWQQFTRQE